MDLLPPVPADEPDRLAALRGLDLLDTPPEAEFEALVALARDLTGCPIALVSLIDDDRQWFKARCGLGAEQTPREQAFCAHAILSHDLFVVPDATQDPRFSQNPLVLGAPHIRFYAGAPLRLDGQDGSALGTLCIIDTQPRELDQRTRATLQRLAVLAETVVRARARLGRVVRYAEERHDAALLLERQHRQLVMAERLAGIGSWRMTLDDQVVTWSDHVFAIHGLPVGEMPSMHAALDFYPPHARAGVAGALADTIDHGTAFDIETDFIAADGTSKRVQAIGERECDGDMPIALVGVFRDVTARYHLEQSLRRRAQHDPLTGIANRAGFDATLDRALARSGEDGAAPALLLIDLDGFKQINDMHGHAAGDEMLKAVAQRLQALALSGGAAARLGGDEFAFVVLHLPQDDTLADLARRVLEAIARPVAYQDGHIAVSGSIGVAIGRQDVDRVELMHRADLALYEAKRAGKSVTRFWNRALELSRESGARRRVRG